MGGVCGLVRWGAGAWWAPAVAAALAVAADLVLTGALHLDGLADTADGVLPHLDRERRLAVMADPGVGVFAHRRPSAMTLLLRWSALATVDVAGWRWVSCWPGLWCGARSFMAATSATVPYARPEGGLASAVRPAVTPAAAAPRRRARRHRRGRVPAGIAGVAGLAHRAIAAAALIARWPTGGWAGSPATCSAPRASCSRPSLSSSWPRDGDLRGRLGSRQPAGSVAIGLALAQVLPEPPNRYHPVAWFGDAMQHVEARRYRDDRRRGVEHAVSGVAVWPSCGGLLTRRLVGPRPRPRWPRRSPSVVGCSPSRRPPSAPRSSAGDLGAARDRLPSAGRSGPVRSRCGRHRPSGRRVGGGEHRRRARRAGPVGCRRRRARRARRIAPSTPWMPWWAITAPATSATDGRPPAWMTW